MIKAVLFDFDGTLADSSEGIFYTSTTVMKELGEPGPWELSQLRKFIGPPLPDSFRNAFAIKEELVNTAVNRYREIYKDHGPSKCYLYDGMRELLDYLKANNILVGVATNKHQAVTISCLDAMKITDEFDCIAGTLPERPNKTAVIEYAKDYFKLKNEEILMVGDTTNDQDGASNAGVMFVAALWGFGFSSPEDAKGLYYAGNPVEVISIIEKINGGNNMIEKIETKNAPAAIGPYSQAVKVGNFLFASGQIPVDPATGAIVEGTTADQARQCFKNINAVLAEAGTDITKVFKATVFLKDMNDFVSVNEVYAEAFKDNAVLPARSAVQVAKLPKDVGVEIEVIALI